MSTPEKEITDKQAAFWEAVTGEFRGNIHAAEASTGYSKMTKTWEVVSSLRKEVIEHISLMLAMDAVRGKTNQI